MSARAWPLMVVKPSRTVSARKPAHRKNAKATPASLVWHQLFPWHAGAPMKHANAIAPANQKMVVITRRTKATRAW